MHKLFTLFILSAIHLHAVAQQDSIRLIPSWKKGASHQVKIRSTTVENNKGLKKEFVSMFKAKFVVTAASVDGFRVVWTYTGAEVAAQDPMIDNLVLAKMLNTRFDTRLSPTGQFVELVNFEEVKTAANKALDALAQQSKGDAVAGANFHAMRQMLNGRQSLEMALLKQVKAYTFSFGHAYSVNQAQTTNTQIANPVGNPPTFPGVETIQVTNVDTLNNTCVINTSKIADQKLLNKAAIDYVTRHAKSSEEAMEMIDNVKNELSESTVQKFNYAKGLLQKSTFNKTMKFAFLNRITTLQIEAAD